LVVIKAWPNRKLFVKPTEFKTEPVEWPNIAGRTLQGNRARAKFQIGQMMELTAGELEVAVVTPAGERACILPAGIANACSAVERLLGRTDASAEPDEVRPVGLRPVFRFRRPRVIGQERAAESFAAIPCWVVCLRGRHSADRVAEQPAASIPRRCRSCRVSIRMARSG
jgi:hypothetical protein